MTHKYQAVILTDFNPLETGIQSTALGLIADNKNFHPEIIYSYDNLEFENKIANSKLSFILFTHLEHPNITTHAHKINPLIIHVGDWPMAYRLNEFKFKRNFISLIKIIRCYFNLMALKNNLKKYILVFVNSEECDLAKKFGFNKAKHINIGLDVPKNLIKSKVDPYKLIFSGNFNYPPNKQAAIELINFFSKHDDKNYSLSLIGFNANLLKNFIPNNSNIDLLDNVPSVIQELNRLRGIYISLISFGSGSKNKIMQALVTGCYVIASKESLDNSLDIYKDRIFEINIHHKNWSNVLSNHLKKIIKNQSAISISTNQMSKEISNTRSWKNVSEDLDNLLTIIKK